MWARLLDAPAPALTSAYTAPTTARILEIFTGVARHELTEPNGQVLRTFRPQLTELQRQVLELL